eukprot:SAG11_NODE_178_length_13331_cov_17.694906_1_plen_296_part_10
MYVSRALIDAEKSYSVQEKECLGIVFAMQKFRHYLLGSQFTVRVMTDHSSLRFLTKSKEQGGRIARWAMILSEYNYKVEYLKGKLNVVGDALSRLISQDPTRWHSIAEEDRDTDEKHPFLLLWPELYLCAIGSQYDSMTPLQYHADSKLENEPWPEDPWASTEQKIHEPLNGDSFEERILFNRFTVGADEPKVLQLKPEHYRSDKDFQDLYKYLSFVPNSGTQRTQESVTKKPRKRHKQNSIPTDHIMYRFIPRPNQHGHNKDIHSSWGKSRQDWDVPKWKSQGFVERNNPLPPPS